MIGMAVHQLGSSQLVLVLCTGTGIGTGIYFHLSECFSIPNAVWRLKDKFLFGTEDVKCQTNPYGVEGMKLG